MSLFYNKSEVKTTHFLEVNIDTFEIYFIYALHICVFNKQPKNMNVVCKIRICVDCSKLKVI